MASPVEGYSPEGSRALLSDSMMSILSAACFSFLYQDIPEVLLIGNSAGRHRSGIGEREIVAGDGSGATESGSLCNLCRMLRLREAFSIVLLLTAACPGSSLQVRSTGNSRTSMAVCRPCGSRQHVDLLCFGIIQQSY